MFAVDTNVFLYAADRAAPEHDRARRLVEVWRRQASPWYTTWGVIYEFMRVVTHPRVLRQPWTAAEAWTFVEALRASPGLEILVHTERHADVAAEMISEAPDLRGNLVHDAHTAVLMREHGIRRLYTCDTNFHRFPFIEVLDPLAAS
jgi:toxin-antitoxin system PIN domain toxin